ncbi:uncharacterized protein LOC130786490 [Actinidia eriantha]|uniref:uncharacterized protein LOC130786490 n=1 Tax=Actinidia eriantha TaxID=165200 RepID=UPI00258D9AD2|nr:uncharacterized protein LOC130786490 [Actinidia eriantha]
MMFYLTTLNLAGCLTEEAPVVAENEKDSQKVIARDHWKNADYLCKNYILNALEDSLYSVYNDMKSAKELWESLDRKYKIEGAGSKKFIVGRFLDYVMLDTRSITAQFQELQLNVEEENRARNKVVKPSYMAKANIMEHGQSSKTKKSKDKWSNNQKGKSVKLGPKRAIAKKPIERFQEFIALDKAAEEAEWLRQFLEDIPRWLKPVSAITIHCDSQSAIGRAQSNMYNVMPF